MKRTVTLITLLLLLSVGITSAQSVKFKSSDPDIHWFRPRPGCLEAMEEAIRGWLMDSDGPSLTPPGVAQGNA